MEPHLLVGVTLLGRCLPIWVMLVAGANDSKIQKISTKFTHVWMGIFMSIETKLCNVVVAHVKDMLHWCQHASIEQESAIPNLSERSKAQTWYPQTQKNIQMLFPCQLAHFNIRQAHANFLFCIFWLNFEAPILQYYTL